MLCGFIFVATPASAFARQGALDDAPNASAPPSTPAPSPLIVPTASATTNSSSDRPVRGPAVRERGGRRSRAGSAASGVLMLALLVGLMGYYVVKKLRR
jgi:hypothetical protein